MKIILLCNSDLLAVPAAAHLHNTGHLVAVGVTEKSVDILKPTLASTGIADEDIYALNKKNIKEKLIGLIDKYKAEAVFVMTFPWRIPAAVLKLPANGCINFHFGILPKYKGADPVFWQLKNRENKGGVSVHVMTEEIDAGPILLIDELPVIPGETFGIHCQRLGALNAGTVVKVMKLLKAGTSGKNTSNNMPALFYKAPDNYDLTINWQTQTADEIEWLVNAANPRYGGAITHIRQMQVRILEVAPAIVNIDPGNKQEILSGSIVYADIVYGLIVACSDKQFLKINVVFIQEGYLSGVKLFSLGFKAGEFFY